ncbi:MAG: cupin domain-containing protein [Gaiellales bacterium]
MTHLAHWDDVPRARREIGEIATWMTDLGVAAGTVAVGLRLWETDPDRRNTPPHAHGAEEEIFYVLAGSGLLWQDGEVCEVGAGDCIVHLADEEAHALKAGPDGLDVLSFGMRQYVETCYHPHSGRAWAGATIIAADGPGDMFAFDAEAGPLPWAAPGPRLANVVNAADVAERESGEGDCESAWRHIAAAAGAVRTGLNIGRCAPGMLQYPPHCHSSEEELFVVLEGSGSCILGDVEHPLQPGHVLSRPAGTGVAHALRGGADGLTFLAYGTRDTGDVAYFPRSNKMYWPGLGVIGRIERLDYWDGERDFRPAAQ